MPKNNLPGKTHTLIVSDFHLGSKVSRSGAIKDLLDHFEFKKLILLGDIFESLNFNELTKSDWKLLTLLTDLARKKKVRWVLGNHDKGLTKLFAILTNIKIYKQYKWQYRNIKYLAIHGHQFDNFLVNNVFLSNFINQLYNFIQLVDFEDRRISRFIKQRSKGWLRISKKVARRAIIYARLQRVNVVFCGHTHKSTFMRRGKIKYYNSGCWTDTPATYITLSGEKINIYKYY